MNISYIFGGVVEEGGENSERTLAGVKYHRLSRFELFLHKLFLKINTVTMQAI